MLFVKTFITSVIKHLGKVTSADSVQTAVFRCVRLTRKWSRPHRHGND